MSGFYLGFVSSVLFLISAAPMTHAITYAGGEQGEIKALSTDEIEDYLRGRGAGMAKAAELNHYPGPAHVLELSDELQLSNEQKRRTQAVFDAMHAGAIRLGRLLVDKEKELDQLFAAGEITTKRMESILKQIGELHATIRGTHLNTHIEQRAILSATQISLYDKLRGYSNEDNQTKHDHHSSAKQHDSGRGQ